MKTVNKNLNNFVSNIASESSEITKEIAEKTKMHILRVANFAKHQADIFDDVKKQFDAKITDMQNSISSLKKKLSDEVVNLQENTVQKSEFDDSRNEMKNVLESYVVKASLETELAAMREEINDLKEMHKKPRGWKAVLKIVGRN